MSKFDVSKTGNYGEACLDEDDGIEVPVIKLDDVDDLVNVDVIKIDVEGFEYEVLQGGRGTIEKFRPVILYEANDMDFWQPCYDMLSEMNYKQYWVVCRTRPVGPTFKETDENPFGDGADFISIELKRDIVKKIDIYVSIQSIGLHDPDSITVSNTSLYQDLLQASIAMRPDPASLPTWT
jgi:hypothetical protein